jgi:hypothetical protein
MPQLPSGIHVAVDSAPLTELLETWHLDASREKLSALSSIEDLYPLTRILELVPAKPKDEPLVLADKSSSPPDSMTTRDTGFRLGECPAGLDEWTSDDKRVFQEYVRTRVNPFLLSQLETTQRRCADLSHTFVQQVEAAWMKAGVHPSQEPGWDDWSDDPNIDVFDQLVALLQCRDAIATAVPGEVPAGNTVDRLQGVMAMAAGALPWLPKAVLPTGPTAQLADALRKAFEPGAFAPDRRDWWVTQVSIECNNLFNDPALEPFLMANAPKAYGVIRLTAISTPDGR